MDHQPLHPRHEDPVGLLLFCKQILSYTFNDIHYLYEAITHQSYRGKRPHSNKNDLQRLEFVGDRILNEIIAIELFEMFPQAREGELGRWHGYLVSADVCQEIAVRLGIQNFLLAFKQTQSSLQNIAKDCLEAIVAAIFFDGGYECAKEFIIKQWNLYLFTLPKLINQWYNVDPKTYVQEWCQSKKMKPPKYVVVKTEGPKNAPEFTIDVQHQLFPSMPATGSNIKQAEKQVALRIVNEYIQKLQNPEPPPLSTITTTNTPLHALVPVTPVQ